MDITLFYLSISMHISYLVDTPYIDIGAELDGAHSLYMNSLRVRGLLISNI